ncbi:hypothetical protein EDB85DRAFT_1943256 [Lactarius pseudohatsudake]|nr:hypothetical protein EDB85DRAFT_1943256 [Lactarius pseudohatsudake]
MSLPHSDSLELICSILTFTLMNSMKPTCRYRLDDLLSAMLLHAPNSLGQRYVAICLHIAHEKGEDGVVTNAAKAWLDNLLLPMMAISKAMKTEPASSQTPTIDITMQHIVSPSRKDQRRLRTQVSIMPSSSRFCLLMDLRSLSENSIVVRSQRYSTALAQRNSKRNDALTKSLVK